MPIPSLANELGPMRQLSTYNFTLNVEHLGPIRSGAVTLAPLTVLVGRNGTGKSYLASILWSLMSHQLGPFYLDRRLPAFFQEARDRSIETGDWVEIDVTAGTASAVLNDAFEANTSAYLSRLMSSELVKAGKIWLDFHPASEHAVSRIKPRDSDEKFVASWGPSFAASSQRGLDISFDPDFERALADPFMSLIRAFMTTTGSDISESSSYIPAARTGLILALRSLVQSSLENLGLPRESPNSTLTLPLIRFIQELSQPAREGGEFAAIADWLESAVLDGHIQPRTSEGGQVLDYEFRRARAEAALPLHITSSMTTELAPILLAIRRPFTRVFVIEEPESHLHLTAQRQMARAIVRLVNSGAQVVVTTHSDTFLQQLNILIALHVRGQAGGALAAENGLEAIDLLGRDQVRCYEFLPAEEGSDIKEATLTEDGFIVRSINDALESITDLALQAQM